MLPPFFRRPTIPFPVKPSEDRDEIPFRHPSHPHRLQPRRTQPRHHAADLSKFDVRHEGNRRTDSLPLRPFEQSDAQGAGRHGGRAGARRGGLCLRQRHGGHRLRVPHFFAAGRHRCRRLRHLRRQLRFADRSLRALGGERRVCRFDRPRQPRPRAGGKSKREARLAGNTVQPAFAAGGHRRAGGQGQGGRRAGRHRQHFCHAVSTTAAGHGLRHRFPFGHQIFVRPLGRFDGRGGGERRKAGQTHAKHDGEHRRCGRPHGLRAGVARD